MLESSDLDPAEKVRARTQRYAEALLGALAVLLRSAGEPEPKRAASLDEAPSFCEDALASAPDHDAWVWTWERYCLIQGARA